MEERRCMISPVSLRRMSIFIDLFDSLVKIVNRASLFRWASRGKKRQVDSLRIATLCSLIERKNQQKEEDIKIAQVVHRQCIADVSARANLPQINLRLIRRQA